MIPADGFIFDLFWFGGTFYGPSGPTRMGTISWDQNAFPNVQQNVQTLKKAGAGIVLISESYISDGLKEYTVGVANNYFAQLNGQVSYIDYNPWYNHSSLYVFCEEYFLTCEQQGGAKAR